MGGSATEGGEGEKASFLNVAAAETLGEEVAAPEATSFWGVEGGKSVVCCAAPEETPSEAPPEEKPSFPIAASSPILGAEARREAQAKKRRR